MVFFTCSFSFTQIFKIKIFFKGNLLIISYLQIIEISSLKYEDVTVT